MDERESKLNMIGYYIVYNKATTRQTAKALGIPKSTLHELMRNKLNEVNHELYMEVSKTLKYNKDMRHIRGGATMKYKAERLRKAYEEQRQ